MTAAQSTTDSGELYLDLLKRTLTRALFEDADQIVGISTVDRRGLKWRAVNAAARVLGSAGFEVVRRRPYDASVRDVGRDWPARAETMIGLRRMDNLQYCVETVLREDVRGDLIETGVWRGGAAIFMRAILKAHGETGRTVWAADSFRGLPAPHPHRYPADSGDRHFVHDTLRVGVDQVRDNFRRYGLLDDQVRFLVGWFKDTLPTAPIAELAVLRLDGDMYESTKQAMDSLYPKLSPGGYCIVDDYGAVPGCRQAVTDYRRERGINEEIIAIDWAGAFWRKRG
jgi:O-methyltransferase